MEMSTTNLDGESRIVARTAKASMRALAWDAILGGAVAAAALSLILLALGSGLGMSAISPWSYEGASPTMLRSASIAWLILMSACASSVGGYVAGRMRTKWTDIDVDEAYFRDTAHGFLAWAVATILSAVLLSSAALSMAGTATTIGVTARPGAAAITSAAAQVGMQPTNVDYFVDMLFRSDRSPEPGVDMAQNRAEVARIVANAQGQSEISAGDQAYLGQIVARWTGLDPIGAERRVGNTIEAAKLAAAASAARGQMVAEATRRTTSHLALWVFVSLLVGAFCAAFTATLGGRERDWQRPQHSAA